MLGSETRKPTVKALPIELVTGKRPIAIITLKNRALSLEQWRRGSSTAPTRSLNYRLANVRQRVRRSVSDGDGLHRLAQGGSESHCIVDPMSNGDGYIQ